MLLYFILGVAFISLGLPILEALSSIISGWSQYKVYCYAFKIYKLKKEIGVGQDQEEEEQTQILGFTAALGEQVPGQDLDQEEQEE